ncbi:helix-turn-helix domain-containing protein [Frankia sp. AgB32]|uniref:helix-turn-helix domain-containing protein n=1 Tax=Frankia sp. AgB32 TaxID=631119 RepID=UPI00200F9B7A|nr:helix-turn-helix domain-containing protein [Frankia sp. AgB32]MCK9894726.1 hypothetical protein [Frankia sp. AgB32]
MTAGQVGALLLAVELAGRPVRARMLAAALRLPPAEVRTALYRLQQGGIVHSDGRRWSPTTIERGN